MRLHALRQAEQPRRRAVVLAHLVARAHIVEDEDALRAPEVERRGLLVELRVVEHVALHDGDAALLLRRKIGQQVAFGRVRRQYDDVQLLRRAAEVLVQEHVELLLQHVAHQQHEWEPRLGQSAHDLPLGVELVVEVGHLHRDPRDRHDDADDDDDLRRRRLRGVVAVADGGEGDHRKVPEMAPVGEVTRRRLEPEDHRGKGGEDRHHREHQREHRQLRRREETQLLHRVLGSVQPQEAQPAELRQEGHRTRVEGTARALIRQQRIVEVDLVRVRLVEPRGCSVIGPRAAVAHGQVEQVGEEGSEHEREDGHGDHIEQREDREDVHELVRCHDEVHRVVDEHHPQEHLLDDRGGQIVLEKPPNVRVRPSDDVKGLIDPQQAPDEGAQQRRDRPLRREKEDDQPSIHDVVEHLQAVPCAIDDAGGAERLVHAHPCILAKLRDWRGLKRGASANTGGAVPSGAKLTRAGGRGNFGPWRFTFPRESPEGSRGARPEFSSRARGGTGGRRMASRPLAWGDERRHRRVQARTRAFWTRCDAMMDVRRAGGVGGRGPWRACSTSTGGAAAASGLVACADF